MAGPAPVLLALVDATGGDEWIELVRSALLAALEAVPPYTLFGLCTFSNKVSRANAQSSPRVHSVNSPPGRGPSDREQPTCSSGQPFAGAWAFGQ